MTRCSDAAKSMTLTRSHNKCGTFSEIVPTHPKPVLHTRMSSTERSDNIYLQFADTMATCGGEYGLGTHSFSLPQPQYCTNPVRTDSNTEDLSVMSMFLTKASHEMLMRSGNEAYRSLSDRLRVAEAKVKVLRYVCRTHKYYILN